MIICFFTQNVSKGGLDSFIINLLSKWPLNHKLFLFCNKSHPGFNDLEKALSGKVTLIAYDFLISQDLKLKYSNCPKFLYLIIRLLFWILGFPYMVWKIRKLLKSTEINYFMVINGGYPGGDACLAAPVAWSSLRRNVPKAWLNFHNLTLTYSRNPIRLFKEFIIDIIIKNSVQGFVGVSNACLESLKVRPLLVHSKSLFIYNGIQPLSNTDSFSLKLEFGLPDNSQILLMLATYEERKGHHFIFKAMEEILKTNPDVFLLILGYGRSDDIKRVKYHLQNSTCRMNVHLGNHREINSNLLKQADVLVIPSQSQESFGYTAVEAMSCGVPVVCTNVGGLPEVVEHGVSGYVIDKDDFYQFAFSLNTLLADSVQRESMGTAGIKRVEELFTAERMTRQYVQLIQN